MIFKKITCLGQIHYLIKIIVIRQELHYNNRSKPQGAPSIEVRNTQNLKPSHESHVATTFCPGLKSARLARVGRTCLSVGGLLRELITEGLLHRRDGITYRYLVRSSTVLMHATCPTLDCDVSISYFLPWISRSHLTWSSFAVYVWCIFFLSLFLVYTFFFF